MVTAEAYATDRWLTVEQVAARLQVSKGTIYRLISNGQLPAVQLAGPRSTLRISQRELEEWLFGGSRTSGEAA
jgi:excisionase family DNA binding protein